MIYEALKWLIEWLQANYKCPECNSNIWEWDIDIVWAAWNTANFDITCPKCQKHWIIKSQLVILDTNWLSEIKHSIENIKDKIWSDKITEKITDTEIIELDKDLKNKKINVSDLFD